MPIVYIASDGAGMTEDDLITTIKWQIQENPHFVFADWYCVEDFLGHEAFYRLKQSFGTSQ